MTKNKYWEKKPIYISEPKLNGHLILKSNELLKNVQKEIGEFSFNLEHRLLDISNDDDMSLVLNFIRTNYVYPKNKWCYKYSSDLLHYFMGKERSNVLAVLFTSKGTSIPVGCVIGVKRNFCLYNNKYPIVEGNFLCVVPELRNMHISSYFISILAKLCITHFGVPCSFFTTSVKLDAVNFCEKIYYQRPLSIEKLCNVEMLLLDENQTNIYKKLYNSFSYTKEFKKNHEIVYINGDNHADGLIDIPALQQKLNAYYKSNYKVYSDIDLADVLSNKAFHCYIFKNKEGAIVDFISIFKLDIEHTDTDSTTTTFSNGFVHSMFLNGGTIRQRSFVIEMVSEHLHKNNIVDILTISEPFCASPNEYHSFKFLETSSLNYYFYNVYMQPTAPYQVGICTI